MGKTSMGGSLPPRRRFLRKPLFWRTAVIRATTGVIALWASAAPADGGLLKDFRVATNLAIDTFLDYEKECPSRVAGVRVEPYCAADGRKLDPLGEEWKSLRHLPDRVDEMIWVEEAARLHIQRLGETKSQLIGWLAALDASKKNPYDEAIVRELETSALQLATVEAAIRDIKNALHVRVPCLDTDLRCHQDAQAEAEKLTALIEELEAIKSGLIGRAPFLMHWKIVEWANPEKRRNRVRGSRELRSALRAAVSSAFHEADARKESYLRLLADRNRLSRAIASPPSGRNPNREDLESFGKLIGDTLNDPDLIRELVLANDLAAVKGLEGLQGAQCRLNNRLLTDEKASIVRGLAFDVVLTAGAILSGNAALAALNGSGKAMGYGRLALRLGMLGTVETIGLVGASQSIKEKQNHCSSIRGALTGAKDPLTQERLGSELLACDRDLRDQRLINVLLTGGSVLTSVAAVPRLVKQAMVDDIAELARIEFGRTPDSVYRVRAGSWKTAKGTFKEGDVLTVVHRDGMGKQRAFMGTVRGTVTETVPGGGSRTVISFYDRMTKVVREIPEEDILRFQSRKPMPDELAGNAANDPLAVIRATKQEPQLLAETGPVSFRQLQRNTRLVRERLDALGVRYAAADNPNILLHFNAITPGDERAALEMIAEAASEAPFLKVSPSGLPKPTHSSPKGLAFTHPRMRELVEKLEKEGASLVVDPTLEFRRFEVWGREYGIAGYFDPNLKVVAIPPNASWTTMLHEYEHFLFSKGLGDTAFEAADLSASALRRLAKTNPDVARLLRQLKKLRKQGMERTAANETLATNAEIAELRKAGFGRIDVAAVDARRYGLSYQLKQFAENPPKTLAEKRLYYKARAEDWVLEQVQDRLLKPKLSDSTIRRIGAEAVDQAALENLPLEEVTDRLMKEAMKKATRDTRKRLATDATATAAAFGAAAALEFYATADLAAYLISDGHGRWSYISIDDLISNLATRAD